MRFSSVKLNKRLNRAVFALSSLLLLNPAFSSEVAHDREIHLKGTSNTRDIGGYLTSDLRSLRWGQLIRSENLSRLTPNDFKKLEEMGVKTVIDLRTEREHDQSPTVWQGDNPPQFYHFPVGDARNDWFKAQRKLMKSNRFTEKQALDHMVEGYRMIADVGPPSYEKLMELVLDESNWPIVFHCNAGKDRAGIATTLILEAVGVDRETIMEEFLLTNEMSRTEAKAAILSRERKSSRSVGRSSKGPSASAWYPIVGVKAEMLEAFYASVEEQYGSMDVFLTEIGVDKDARRALTAALTTPAISVAMNE